MRKNVLITISGLQPGVNPDEAVEITSVGTCMHRDGKWYLTYEEADDEGHLSKCRIKAQEGVLVMEKTGHVNTRMEFTPGQVYESVYQTPYGEFDLKMLTKDVSFPETDDLIAVNLLYELGVNGQFLSDCKLGICVTEVEE